MACVLNVFFSLEKTSNTFKKCQVWINLLRALKKLLIILRKASPLYSGKELCVVVSESLDRTIIKYKILYKKGTKF